MCLWVLPPPPQPPPPLLLLQVHLEEADARAAAAEACEGLRAARIAEMSVSGSMVTLSSLATLDEETDALQVCVCV